MSEKKDENTQTLRESIKRDELGGSQRLCKNEEKRENRPPVSRDELSKGAQVFGEAKVNWAVLSISAIIILAFPCGQCLPQITLLAPWNQLWDLLVKASAGTTS